MLNIIKIKEEQNILSFDEDSKIDIVGESTNFYLEFELDEEWLQCPIVTVVFDFQGQLVQVELDENYQCQIPRSNAPKVVFSITGEPSQTEKLSSTMLCLNILPTDNTNLQDIPFYEDAHRNLLGIIADLEEGNITAKNALSADYAETAGTVENATHATTADSATYAETTGNVENANHATTADSAIFATTAGSSTTATNADNATFATTAGTSQTQVSLTGNETITGTKNFTGNLQLNGVTVATANDLATKQNTLTFDSTPTASSTNPVTSSGVYNSIIKKIGAPTSTGIINISVPANNTYWQNTTGKNGYIFFSIHHTNSSDVGLNLAISPESSFDLSSAIMAEARICATDDRTGASWIVVPKGWYVRMGYSHASVNLCKFIPAEEI